jgi:hypothetical protein
MAMGKAYGLVGLVAAACSSDATAGSGGLGLKYSCPGNAGDAGANGEAGASNGGVECITGQNYCFVRMTQANAIESAVCEPIAAPTTQHPNPPTGCASDPSCACICAQGVSCKTECSCDDSDGVARVTCHQI